MVQAIFLWIYRMDIPAVLILTAAASALFIRLFRQPALKYPRPVAGAFLLAWLVFALRLTVLDRVPGPVPPPVWMPLGSYAEAFRQGGQREMLRSNLMNILLFYPAGLLSGVLPRKCSVSRLLGLSALWTSFSLVIELLQYRFSLGLVQTDDVLHNALGAFTGAAVMLLARRNRTT